MPAREGKKRLPKVVELHKVGGVKWGCEGSLKPHLHVLALTVLVSSAVLRAQENNVFEACRCPGLPLLWQGDLVNLLSVLGMTFKERFTLVRSHK